MNAYAVAIRAAAIARGQTANRVEPFDPAWRPRPVVRVRGSGQTQCLCQPCGGECPNKRAYGLSGRDRCRDCSLGRHYGLRDIRLSLL